MSQTHVIEDNFCLKCSSPPMRGILSELWEPKEGDRIIIKGEDSYGGSWHQERLLTELDLKHIHQNDNVIGAFKDAKVIVWLLDSDDLAKMLKDQAPSIFFLAEGGVIITLPNGPSDGIQADTFREALLKAFGWVKGLKWDGKWERR